MRTRARLAAVPLLALLLAASLACAQDYGQPPPPAYGQAYEQAPPARAFSQEELEQMLAPIALYPDALLAQILMASTYPLEVVEAARWARANPGLRGDQAVAAAEQFDWDPSVKSLTAFPQILLVLDERLDWTRRLGDAFLAQQGQVMDTVQFLRRKAYDAGNLRTTEQIQVQPVAQAIDIGFANPQVAYVPYYDPTVVYGSWWWPSYPPVYWAPWPGYGMGYVPGFYWGPAVYLPLGFFFGAVDWHSHHVNIICNDHYNKVFIRHPPGAHSREDTTQWRHDPAHRQNVPYRSPAVRQQFNPQHRPPETRELYRGYQAPPGANGAPMSRQIPQRETAPPRAPQPAPRGFPNREAPAPIAPQPAPRPVPNHNAPAQFAPRPAIRPAPERRPSAFETIPQGQQAREFSARGRASQQNIAPRSAPPAAAPAIAPAARPPAIAPAPRSAAPNEPARPAGRGREQR